MITMLATSNHGFIVFLAALAIFLLAMGVLRPRR